MKSALSVKVLSVFLSVITGMNLGFVYKGWFRRNYGMVSTSRSQLHNVLTFLKAMFKVLLCKEFAVVMIFIWGSFMRVSRDITRNTLRK